MEDKEVYVADFPSEIIKEGKVQILVPNLKAYGVVPSDFAPSKAPVFYNPVMEFNRDLTVLAFKAYQHIVNHEISICEPFTSQGIRGIRFAAEVEGVKRVLLNDINTSAYKLAKYNIEFNKQQDKIVIKNKDANCVLSCNASPRSRFDIVDIDPFGTPVPYLDSAFQALKNRGLLAATATDLAPLCGVHAKACLRKYGIPCWAADSFADSFQEYEQGRDLPNASQRQQRHTDQHPVSQKSQEPIRFRLVRPIS